jgi:hypothetical protein
MPSNKTVNGDDLIYAFLQDLFAADDPALRDVPRRMLMTLGIWFPSSVYSELPVLLPWVVRDPTCRGTKGVADQWSSPNRDGYLRDDNSKIKNIPRSLNVDSPHLPRLHGARMGTEFVASHIWRELPDGGPLASRRPLLNSFVPNLVWLPKQIAKLTDREGSPVQRTLQAISWGIYRRAPVEPAFRNVVEQAWSLLPAPAVEIPVGRDQVNFFMPTPAFVKTRHDRIRRVLDGLLDLRAGGELSDKQLIDRRYTNGMPSIAASKRDALSTFLSQFATARHGQ